MKFKDTYLSLIGIHIVLGVLVFIFPLISKVYFFGTIAFFLYKILFAHPNSKRTVAVVQACCYIAGAEVLFRMTGGNVSYEASKYLVIVFCIIGLFLQGASNKSFIYFICLILLIPSVLVALQTLDYDADFRKSVLFVLSGPICLLIAALYFFDKHLKVKDAIDALAYLSFPIVSMTTYIFLYTPSIKSVLSGTGSNFATSGGFGPNQVSTVLGLGIFAFTVRLLIKSPTLILKIVNAILLILIAFRGIVTFSRGGIITAIGMIVAFLAIYAFKANVKRKQQLLLSVGALIVLASVTWVISSNQTSGLIDKRYANQDARGRTKADVTTGRVDLIDKELDGFKQHPFLGLGANGAKKIRSEIQGFTVASHNELSRLLSEHGIFGVIILLALIITPLIYRANNTRNIFFYSFLVFWFATINHSAMRIAAPGLIYALSLLNVTYEKRPVRRKLSSK